jgi:hypothetical protein
MVVAAASILLLAKDAFAPGGGRCGVCSVLNRNGGVGDACPSNRIYREEASLSGQYACLASGRNPAHVALLVLVITIFSNISIFRQNIQKKHLYFETEVVRKFWLPVRKCCYHL